MKKILLLESVAGIAGDMFAASFVDAGLVLIEELQAIPGLLGLENVEIRVEKVLKAQTRATHLAVCLKTGENFVKIGKENLISVSGKHSHTHYAKIIRQIEDSKLENSVKILANKIFRLIAEAEAEVHGKTLESVAFHEIGMIDSIVDVVMAAYCLEKTSADKIFASPLRVGRGFVKIAHGTHPIPPPASAKLLKNMPVASVPGAIKRENIELSTPTGIAILKAIAPEFINEMPDGTILQSGSGAGTMDLGDFPNIFRVILLEENTETKSDRDLVSSLKYEHDEIFEVSCNIDDDTAEHISWLAVKLLEKAALDVWQTPMTGKKGRSAVCLTFLATESNFANLADWLLRNGTTFGIRYRKMERLKLVRNFEKRETANGAMTYKIGTTTDGEILKEKPEFEEAKEFWEQEREVK